MEVWNVWKLQKTLTNSLFIAMLTVVAVVLVEMVVVVVVVVIKTKMSPSISPKPKHDVTSREDHFLKISNIRQTSAEHSQACHP